MSCSTGVRSRGTSQREQPQISTMSFQRGILADTQQTRVLSLGNLVLFDMSKSETTSKNRNVDAVVTTSSLKSAGYDLNLRPLGPESVGLVGSGNS